jgi:hypothetical protein
VPGDADFKGRTVREYRDRYEDAFERGYVPIIVPGALSLRMSWRQVPYCTDPHFLDFDRQEYAAATELESSLLDICEEYLPSAIVHKDVHPRLT